MTKLQRIHVFATFRSLFAESTSPTTQGHRNAPLTLFGKGDIMKSSGLLRKRDFIVLGLIAILVYISLESTSFTYRIDPAWYLDLRIGAGGADKTLKAAALSLDWYVPPVITDLDGDGSKEVIVITKDLQLKILSADPLGQDTSEIYTPVEIASTRLTALNVHKGRAPVALKTGYVDEYSPTKERTQVIVVVKEDWTVTCYDSNLRVIWEKAVAHKTHEIESIISKYKIDQVAVHLTALPITEGASGGAIIVGASMGIRRPEDVAHIDIEQGLDLNEDGNKEHADLSIQTSLAHFSVYALDAVDGHIVWRHDGSDVRAEQYVRSLPQHAYKLDVRDLMSMSHHAPGINHWTVFKQSLIDELPHDWHTNEDTSLRLAHFVRRHIGTGTADVNAKTRKNRKRSLFSSPATISNSKKQQSEGKGKNNKNGKSKHSFGKAASSVDMSGRFFTGVETPPLPQSASLPHDASEHTEHPNVVLAHTKRGLEAISLQSGAPITSLALTQGQSYADLDGDGVVDTILVLETIQDVASRGEAFAHEAGQLQHCMVMVTSGLPPKSQLFNGTICPTGRSLQDPVLHSRVKSKTLPDAVSAASPVVLRTIDKKTLQESKLRDLVIAVNTGVVTCYSGDGKLKWQLKGAPVWTLQAKDEEDGGSSGSDSDNSKSKHASSHSAILFDSDATRVDDLGKHDNVHANILVVGDLSLALISRDGEILSSSDIPRKPLGRPIIGDFDSDGVNDIIIVTEEAILGYRLEMIQSTRSMLIAVIVLAVLAIIVFFANIRMDALSHHSPSPSLSSSSSSSSSAPFPSSAMTGHISDSKIRKQVLSITRSTDDFHID